MLLTSVHANLPSTRVPLNLFQKRDIDSKQLERSSTEEKYYLFAASLYYIKKIVVAFFVFATFVTFKPSKNSQIPSIVLLTVKKLLRLMTNNSRRWLTHTHARLQTGANVLFLSCDYTTFPGIVFIHYSK